MQIFSNLSYFIVKLNHPFNWWQYYVYKLELICSSAFSSVSSFHLTRFFLIIQLSRFLYLNCYTWLSFYFQYIWPDSISDKNRLVLTFDSWPYSFDTPNLFLTFGTDFFFLYTWPSSYFLHTWHSSFDPVLTFGTPETAAPTPHSVSPSAAWCRSVSPCVPQTVAPNPSGAYAFCEPKNKIYNYS